MLSGLKLNTTIVVFSKGIDCDAGEQTKEHGLKCFLKFNEGINCNAAEQNLYFQDHASCQGSKDCDSPSTTWIGLKTTHIRAIQCFFGSK